jgi:hypothetical protein
VQSQFSHNCPVGPLKNTTFHRDSCSQESALDDSSDPARSQAQRRSGRQAQPGLPAGGTAPPPSAGQDHRGRPGPPGPARQPVLTSTSTPPKLRHRPNDSPGPVYNRSVDHSRGARIHSLSEHFRLRPGFSWDSGAASPPAPAQSQDHPVFSWGKSWIHCEC